MRQAIMEQALVAGTRLPEDIIGRHFGVSRTLVRALLDIARCAGAACDLGRHESGWLHTDRTGNAVYGLSFTRTPRPGCVRGHGAAEGH